MNVARISIPVIVICGVFGGFVSVNAEERELFLDPLIDSVTAGAGIVSVVLSEILLAQAQQSEVPPLSIDLINSFDRIAVFAHSPALDVVSDITQYLALLFPSLAAINTRSDDWVHIGVLYVEAISIAMGAKNALKLAIERYRPFMYEDTVSEDLVSDGDYVNSFPSGHTTVAFTGASFATYMFANYHPHSPWILPMAVGSYAFAAATAALRVLSGNHFITDVIAGAAIGTAIGIAVPLLHMRRRETEGAASDSASFFVTPTSVGIRLRGLY